jgi:hypothetical protein
MRVLGTLSLPQGQPFAVLIQVHLGKAGAQAIAVLPQSSVSRLLKAKGATRSRGFLPFVAASSTRHTYLAMRYSTAQLSGTKSLRAR